MPAFVTLGGTRSVQSLRFQNQYRRDLTLGFKPARFAQSRTNMTCIEVEKKFKASPHSLQKLLEALPSNSVVTSFEDTYFSEELALTNRWLRKRNDVWELKIPVHCSSTQSAKAAVFRELKGTQIWETLTQNNDFTQGLMPFAQIRTLREEAKLSWDKYTVNLTFDICTSEDGFEYTIGEAEILVETPAEADAAVNVLGELVSHFGLEELEGKDGKVLSYLRSKNRSLYIEVVKVLRS